MFDLLAGTFVKEAEPVPIVKKADNNWSAPYTKLRAAEQQVSRLVADATGLPNKELEAFTKELQALYEKYRIPAPEENKK